MLTTIIDAGTRVRRAWKPIGVAAALALLAGCAAPAATTSPAPTAQQSAVAQVSVAEQTLTAAGKIITAYKQLPPCGAGQPVVCSDAATKAHLRQVFDAAYTQVTTAQTQADAGLPVNTVAMNGAIAALQALAAALPTPTTPAK